MKFMLNETSGNLIQKFIENGTPGKGVIDKPSEIGQMVMNSITHPVWVGIQHGFHHIITVLNNFSPEIITVGVMVCAFGMMVSPLINRGENRWLGRLMFVIAGGVIWRMMI